jgi:preprotein translocase subunit SecF
VVVAIILYVAYAFRKVSKPISSWKYGIAAIVALIHDVTIVMAVFAILGKTAGVEVDIPFVVALLTILGYSVNDTIVVFDRVRESLLGRVGSNFEENVNTGVNKSITRSINTSLTTLVVLVSLYFFGGASVQYFALALIIGIIAGTYSSIFLASPLLVAWHQFDVRRAKRA